MPVLTAYLPAAPALGALGKGWSVCTKSLLNCYSAAKLDPDSPAMEKLKKAKKFDPKKSGVMDVLSAHAQGDFSVDRKAIIEAQRIPGDQEQDHISRSS